MLRQTDGDPGLTKHPGGSGGIPLPLALPSLHPQTPGKFLRTLRAHLLAPADTLLSSACHCEPVSCTRAHLPAFCMSLRASAWGPRKGAPFAGRGAIRERCPAPAFGRSWAWRTLGRRHGGLWGDEAWQSVLLAVGQNEKHYLRQIRNRLRICPKYYLFLPFSAGMRIATSLRSSQ